MRRETAFHNEKAGFLIRTPFWLEIKVPERAKCLPKGEKFVLYILDYRISLVVTKRKV